MKQSLLVTLVLLTFVLLGCKEDEYYGNWAKVSILNGSGRANSAVFTIGENVYLIGGDGYYYVPVCYNSTWVYNSLDMSWLETDTLPCSPRTNGVAFSLDGKGYYCGGVDIEGNSYDDLYEFDPTKPVGSRWTLLDSDPYPGGEFHSGLAFAANGYGYVGTGYTRKLGVSSEYYKFDPSKPAGSRWAAVNTPGSQKRYSATVFVIDDKAYIIGGRHNGNKIEVFECFNAMTDEMSVISDNMSKDYNIDVLCRYSASAFSIGGRGYLTCGIKSSGEVMRDTWEYTPDVDKGKGAWQLMGDFEGPTRYGSSACAVGEYGYIFCGQNGRNSTSFKDDVWRFSPNEKYNKRFYK